MVRSQCGRTQQTGGRRQQWVKGCLKLRNATTGSIREVYQRITMKTISAKIPDSDNLMLEKLAKATVGGKSAIVRDAVHEYCAQQMVSQARKAEVLRRTKGVFKEAPLDAEKHREMLSERMV